MTKLATFSIRVLTTRISGWRRIEGGAPPPILLTLLSRSDLRLAVGDAIDGAVIVVGDQQRTVLHLHHIDRAAYVVVVFQEARDEWLDRFDRTILVQLDDNDVTTSLLGPVP